MTITTILLPYPPSANRLWRYVAKRGPIKSAAYREWIEEGSAMVRRQQVPDNPISYPVSVEIALGRPDRRNRDIDNTIKPLLDLLQAASVLENDHLVHRLNVWWCPETVGAMVTMMPLGEA